MSQLALPLKLQDHAVFESFWPAGNDAVVAYLRELVAGGTAAGCWLWGQASTGKTHLLQAVCARLGSASIYLPLRELVDTSPELLEGLASRACICVDDIDAAAGRPGWEIGLFRLWNAAVEAGSMLVVAAVAPPRECGFELPDLLSRLGHLPAFHLLPLGEDERPRALQLRASHRGLELPDETARYLLKRSRRDMTSLYELLDRLDSEALKAQRRLTIPFVRDVIGAHAGC